MIQDVEVEVEVNMGREEGKERLKIFVTEGRIYFELEERGDSSFYYKTFVDIVNQIKEKYG